MNELYVYTKVARLVNWVGGVIAVLVVVVPAFISIWYSYTSMDSQLKAIAEHQIGDIQSFINAQPESWSDNIERFQSAFDHSLVDGEYVRLVDSNNLDVIVVGKPAWTYQYVTLPVHSFGTPVGSFTVGLSHARNLWGGLLATGIGILVALLVWGPGRRVPLSALRHAEDSLREHREHLEELVELRTRELANALQAAEAAVVAKSAFLANMSHELRTPMNGVLGMIEMVRRSMTDSRGLDQLTKAKNSALRLLALLNDILDFSKVDAGRLELEAVRFQLGRTVDNVVGLIEAQVVAKSLSLDVDIPHDLRHESFIGDPLRLEQVLLNLAGNAVKFTRQGKVTLRVTAGDKDQGTQHVRIEVRDTGPGIDPQVQSRLFRPFEQADSTMTREFGGSGLGLAISRQLVDLMGGEIGVVSEPGAGSTFWLVVPLKLCEGAPSTTDGRQMSPPTPESRLKDHYSGRRVLVVEDEPVSQEIAAAMLTDVGLQVDAVADGLAAVAKARESVYDLILMDMQMPLMNGMDATRSIRSHSLNMETPVIAMTANAFDEDRERCMAAGMSEHISKPIEWHQLYESILRWLAKASPPSAALVPTHPPAQEKSPGDCSQGL